MVIYTFMWEFYLDPLPYLPLLASSSSFSGTQHIAAGTTHSIKSLLSTMAFLQHRSNPRWFIGKGFRQSRDPCLEKGEGRVFDIGHMVLCPFLFLALVVPETTF
jgi:hypothetical protein